MNRRMSCEPREVIMYVVLFRNPSNDSVFLIQDHEDEDNPETMLYNTEDEAEEMVKNHPLYEIWPYSIVEAP